MAARCEICGKGPSSGNSVSHSVRRTRRWWKPNLTSVRARVGGGVRRVRICTSCLKAGKVQKVV